MTTPSPVVSDGQRFVRGLTKDHLRVYDGGVYNLRLRARLVVPNARQTADWR